MTTEELFVKETATEDFFNAMNEPTGKEKFSKWKLLLLVGLTALLAIAAVFFFRNYLEDTEVLTDDLYESSSPRSPFQSSQTDSLALLTKAPPLPDSKFIGLRNLGNTCFLSCLLQLLYHCKPFKRHLYANCPDATYGANILRTFHLMDTATRSLGADEINLNGLLPIRFNDKRQHEAVELLKEWINTERGIFEPLDHAYQTRELIIFHDKATPDRALIYPEVKSCIYRDPVRSATLSLQRFLKQKDMYPSANVKSRTIFYNYHKAPEVLLFVISQNPGVGKDTPIEVNEFLKFKKKSDPVPLHDHAGFEADDGTEKLYRLRAFIQHWGQDGSGGHFVTYARDDNNDWWLLNDSSVSKQGRFNKIAQKAANGMIFAYEIF